MFFQKNSNVNQYVSKTLLRNSSTQLSQVQLQSEGLRFSNRLRAFNAAYPLASNILCGIGLFSLFMATAKGYQISQARTEIQNRKERLQQPVTNLNGPDGLNVPWNSSNIDEWLYRPVQITGRQLHYKAMLVPRTLKGQHGYDYIVPVVTKENEDGSQQEGILLNKGFYPQQYFNAGNRYRIENSWDNITFTGYVSQLEDLQHSFGGRGNDKHLYAEDSTSKTRVKFNNAYLPDLAKYTKFTNQDQVKTAVVEVCDFNSPLDENQVDNYELDASQTQLYPFVKRQSAALIQGNDPVKIQKVKSNYQLFGFATSGLAALLIFA